MITFNQSKNMIHFLKSWCASVQTKLIKHFFPTQVLEPDIVKTQASRPLSLRKLDIVNSYRPIPLLLINAYIRFGTDVREIFSWKLFLGRCVVRRMGASISADRWVTTWESKRRITILAHKETKNAPNHYRWTISR